MNEEEIIGKRLLIFLFVGCLVLLAAVSVACIIYSPKTIVPALSSEQYESEVYFEAQYSVSSSESDSVFPIEINKATADELQLIPNIGPATAKLIIDYREEYGSIVSFSELLSIDGIGEKTVETIKEYCVIN